MIELIDPIIKSQKVDISTGLNVHYLEASKNNNNINNQPTALLLHGFPELSFSWRKIMPILANEGFRVIAPDMRGYGLTSGGTRKYDEDISEYRLLNLTTDIISLISALKINKIDLLVGHDAGSSVAGLSALIRPDIFKSVVMMSAPFTGAPNVESNLSYDDPIHKDLENLNPPRKHYQWYYSTPEANKDMHIEDSTASSSTFKFGAGGVGGARTRNCNPVRRPPFRHGRRRRGSWRIRVRRFPASQRRCRFFYHEKYTNFRVWDARTEIARQVVND